MSIYSASSLTVVPSKVEPQVWVRRIVIYRQLSPQPMLIRDIPLTKGVNIIWAEEADDENALDEISGHSAGKTSFCRLFRYLLGEKTYGTKANCALIQRTFPAGYVAAELFVRGKQWAVIRPIGNGRNSYIKPDATIEELIQDRSISAHQDDYPSSLGFDALLDDMDAGAVLRTNRAIEWGHVLAWCTRDQEARFQNCYEWRSPRSESDWPSFRSSKADPLFVMRTTLGLFLPNELKAEEELATLTQTQEELEKKLPGLKQEPQFRINLYERELRKLLRELLPEKPDIESLPFRRDDLFNSDLDRLTTEAEREITKKIRATEDEKDNRLKQIESLNSRISVLEHRQKQLDSMFGIENTTQNETAQGAAQRQQERERFEQVSEQTCLLGGILYRDCHIVQERQESLQISRFQDANALQQMSADTEKAVKSLNQQKHDLRDEIKRLRDEHTELERRQKAKQTDIQGKRDSLRDLASAHRNLAEWAAVSSRSGEFKELDDCREELKKAVEKIVGKKSELDNLLAQHDKSRSMLSSIFNAAIRDVIPSGTYGGEVTLVDRELDFRITHGTAMSGEAVETLAVLLGDLSCLVYNSVAERSRLPGFLLHDSPREADLSLRLYRRFMALAAKLQNDFGSADRCPFQYVITTTTPPPAALRGNAWVKLHLNAAIPDESLFRTNIARRPDGDMPLSDATSTEASQAAENET